MVGLDLLADGDAPMSRADGLPVASLPYPPDYATALRDIDRGLATALDRADRRRGEWLAHELVARAWLERAKLTSSWQDYARAGGALRRSLDLAPANAGPLLLAAAFDLELHRPDGAERRLDALARLPVPPDTGDQAEIEAMRGDIAFYRGDYRRARDHYDRADGWAPGATAFRRAVWHAAMGEPRQAEAWLNRAGRSTRTTPRLAAWLELQRGVLALDHGHVPRASVHFREADRLFPGYWLIEEHLAEALLLQGAEREAERRYRDLVGRTGSPEFMDALAGIALQRGDSIAARRWTSRARAIWRERLRVFPEAAYAHAADHCLAAREWGCAVALARRNFAARPYGEAQVVLIAALRGAGRDHEASAQLARLAASPWRSPPARRLIGQPRATD